MREQQSYSINMIVNTVILLAADGFVTYTVRNHLNLNNAETLRSYRGPVTFFRRMQDEVMNLGEQYVFVYRSEAT